MDDASEGGPIAAMPAAPGDAGRGWAKGSDISEVSIAFAAAKLRDLLEAEDPPGVEVAPRPA